MSDIVLKLKRSKKTLALLDDHKAFSLLCLIAVITKRQKELVPKEVETGEALLSPGICGFTKEELKIHLVTLMTSGIIKFELLKEDKISVKIINQDIIDINDPIKQNYVLLNNFKEKILERLKPHGVVEFTESSQTQRRWLHNLYMLVKRKTNPVSQEDFEERLNRMIKHDFWSNHLNSLKNIYNFIKAPPPERK